MTELIIIEETYSLKTIRETAEQVRTLLENLEQHIQRGFLNTDSREINPPKQPYKMMNAVFCEFSFRQPELKKRGLTKDSLNSFNENYPLMAEYIAYTYCLKEDDIIEFYQRDKLLTKKQFEQRNYICTILPHERAKIFNFTEEEIKEYKEMRPSGPPSIFSNYDFTKDTYKEFNFEQRDSIKKEYAYNHSSIVPPYERLRNIIKKNNLTSNMLWKSEIRFGKSKVACIYHIALHFNDFSIFNLPKSPGFEKEYLERMKIWFHIHGYELKL